MTYPHFAEMVFIQARKHGDRNAMWYRDYNTKTWKGISWNEFADKIKSVAKAMSDLGIRTQDNIAIFSQNKPESFVVDFAAFALRAVSVPLYAISTESQVEYIVNDATISTIFVGEQYQYDIAYEVMRTSDYIKQIIVFDNTVVTNGEESTIYFSEFVKRGQQSNSDDVVEESQRNALPQELATIMYTSGTTGEPKGAMLSHENYLEAMRIHDLRLTSMSEKDTSIAFLPISHIFERIWCYYCLFKGVEIYVNLNPLQIQDALKEVRPTLMCSVPRFWEKIYTSVFEIIDSYNPLMQAIVASAVTFGSRYNLDYVRTEKKAPCWLKFHYYIVDKLILSKVKKTIGIENANFLPVAGAALSDDINIFFRSIGVPILYGYGLTETTATVSCFNYTHYKIGTVGEIMPELEVKIGENNEILVKGKTVFSGYYKRPELNAVSFTPDGFFKTGDAGYLEKNELILTERIKDLFKTSNGKYIAPQHIETTLIVDKYIEQVAAIGNQRNFVSAIIVPNMEELKKYAHKEGIQVDNIDSFLKDKRIINFYADRISLLQKDMAGYEQVKKFVLSKNRFTIETGELTNTLKLRRSIILFKYKKAIEKMYNEG